MSKLEKDVRDPCVRAAKAYGDVKHKRMHFGHGTANGWPDDLFIFSNGHHWWVEFKRPEGEATPLQAERHKEMRAYKADVSVIDDEDLFLLELAKRRIAANR